MAIKKIIKIAKEIMKPKKKVEAKIKEEQPLELKKEQVIQETKSENVSSLTKETN